MNALQQKAQELLANGQAQVVIGYGKGSNGKSRAVFAQKPEQAGSLIWDDTCRQNLATYLFKPEIKKLGKLALIASTPVLRSVIQLAAENQIQEGEITLLAVQDLQLIEISDWASAEKYVNSQPLTIDDQDRRTLEELDKLSMQERWQYWQEEVSRCFKCYACRAACPMCYCTRCTVECNQPQWIPVAAHQQGTWEWHIMRAMHLAGRCISCGACGRACPLDIPIHLLTMKVEEDIFKEYGVRAGTAVKTEHALSSYRANDSETFII